MKPKRGDIFRSGNLLVVVMKELDFRNHPYIQVKEIFADHNYWFVEGTLGEKVGHIDDMPE